MAKFIPAGASPNGSTDQALQFSANQYGGSNFQQHPNNLSSTSPQYVSMNNTVIALDGTFKQLSPLVQAIWNTEALNYAGVAVCGCKAETISGQKLFRLVNFWNTLRGFAWVNIPPPTSVNQGVEIEAVNVAKSPPNPTGYVQLETNMNWNGFWILLNMGKGLTNPFESYGFIGSHLFYITSTTTGQIFYFASPQTKFSYCIFDTAGQPIGTGIIQITEI